MRLLIVGEGSVSEEVRSFQAYKYFSELDTFKGEKLETILQVLPHLGGDVEIHSDIDVVILSRPMWPPLIKVYQDNGAVVIADQDDDFMAIPNTHVAYKSIGPGNPKRTQDHQISLTMVDQLIVSTPILAERFATRKLQSPENITIIPNAWANRNPLWDGSSLKSSRIVIGWGGTITHREDFKIAIPALEAVVWPKYDVDIRIVGDPKIYQMLRNVAEYGKLFIPMVEYKVYPLVLTMCDIWLAPLVDDHFNRSKSDIKLVEAGAAGIPWIASPVPQYEAWKHGGIFADSHDAWHAALLALIESPELRASLGASGRTHAEARKFDNVFPLWEHVVEKAYELKQNADTLLLRRQQNRMELFGMADESSNAGNKPDGRTPSQDDVHRRSGRGHKRKRK